MVQGQALSGQYTIGGPDGDFPSVANAASNLNAQGVGDGGVEFLIRDGVYSVAFTISAIGAPDKPIVFRSESGDASSVVITTVISDDVVTIDGASYVTIEDVQISVVGNNAYSAIEIQGAANHIQIKNCLINGSGGALTAYAGACIYASEASLSQNCTDILIENNVFSNGSYAFSMDMAGTVADSIWFKGNVCTNQSGGGLYMKDLLAPEVSGNRIFTNQTANTGYKGVIWNNCTGLGRITSNYIYATESGRLNYGVELNSSAGSPGSEIIVANNSIQVQNGNSICYALAQSNNCNFYKIFHNTLYVSGGSSSSSSPYQTFTFNADTDFFNNILVSESEGTSNRCVYIANQSGMNFIDYNVYWTENATGNFTGYFGSAMNNFDAYLAATNEQFSRLLNPVMVYTEGFGWRATNELLMNGGLFVPDFDEDIDGFSRPDPPSIGAHEMNQLSTSIVSKQPIWVGFHLTEREVVFPMNASTMVGVADVRIYGISGIVHRVEKSTISQTYYALDRSKLEPGLYFIEWYMNDGFSYLARFIIPR